MYLARPDLQAIPGVAEQIVAIIESINSPMVAAEGRPLEPAKAYIVGMRNPGGMFSIYIYLHLLQSAACLIYLHDPVEIPLEQYHDTELEALQFVESMGFMVDNLNFRNLSPDQQREILDRLPVFAPDLSAFTSPDQNAGDTAESATESAAGDILELEPLEEPAQQVPAVLDKKQLERIARMLSSF